MPKQHQQQQQILRRSSRLAAIIDDTNEAKLHTGDSSKQTEAVRKVQTDVSGNILSRTMEGKKKMTTGSSSKQQHENDSIPNLPSIAESLPNEILEMILSHLKTSDLLKCRLVSSKWTANCTRVLMLRKEIRKLFGSYSDQFPGFKADKNISDLRLTAFTEFLTSTRPSNFFSCSRFEFLVSTNLEKEIKSFFSSHGHLVTNLYLNFNCFYESGPNKDKRTITLLQTLLGNCPNLTDLKLHLSHDLKDDEAKISKYFKAKKISLPKLTTLKINTQNWEKPSKSWGRVLQEIINTAENLQSVAADLYPGYLNFLHLPILIPANKFHVVTSILFTCKASDDGQLFQSTFKSFENANFSGLKKLEIDSVDVDLAQKSEWSKSLTNLLNSTSSSSLKIEMIGAFSQVHLNFKPLLGLKELYLHFADDGSSVFPPGFSFSSSFPNLYAFEVGICGVRDSTSVSWENVASTKSVTESHGKVRQVKIWGRGTPSLEVNYIEKMSRFFPNLQKLELGQVKDFSRIGLNIWTHLTHLTSLKLVLCVDDPDTSDFDAAFTGVPKSVCSKWRKKKRMKLTEAEVEVGVQTENVSLLNLKSLTDLKLEIDGLSFSTSNAGFKVPIISFVTGQLVFSRMAQLQVQVVFQDSNYLRARTPMENFTAWASMEKFMTIPRRRFF